jgi:hypothetical protein
MPRYVTTATSHIFPNRMLFSAVGSADPDRSSHPVACLRTWCGKRLQRLYSGPVPDLEIRRVEYDFGGAKLANVCDENAVCSLDLNRTVHGSAQLASEVDFGFRTFRLHFVFPEHRANLRRVADGDATYCTFGQIGRPSKRESERSQTSRNQEACIP